MANRYLQRSDAVQRLKSGQAIEQWLEAAFDGNDRLIKWLRIHLEKPGEFGVCLLTVYDQGDKKFIDISEFQPYFPDEPYGVLTIFEDPESAISYSVDCLGAKPDKFVNDGVVQNEYLDFVTANGTQKSGFAK